MKGNKNTVAFQYTINWKHVSLTLLHLVVFILSLSSADFYTKKEPVGALS